MFTLSGSLLENKSWLASTSMESKLINLFANGEIDAKKLKEVTKKCLVELKNSKDTKCK